MPIPERPSWLSVALRRRLLVLAYTVGVVLAVAIAVALSFIAAFWPKLETPDRLSAINDVLAGSALLVGVIGGCLALQAHMAATGLPDLRAQLWFGSDPKNLIVMVMRRDQNGRQRSAPVASQNTLHVRLSNVGKFNAENIVVTLHLRGLAFDRALGEDIDGWRVIDHEAGAGATAVEWVSEVVLHAGTTRRLAALDLRSVIRTGTAEPHIGLYLLANGVSRHLELEVHVLDNRGAGRPSATTAPEWV